MAMVTFLVALGSVGILIACGIAINLRLYSQGAFRSRGFSRSRRLEAAFAGQDAGIDDQFYYISNDAVDKGMGHYARRVITTFFGVLVVLCMIVALLLSTAPH